MRNQIRDRQNFFRRRSTFGVFIPNPAASRVMPLWKFSGREARLFANSPILVYLYPSNRDSAIWMNEESYIANLHKGDENTFRIIFEEYHARLCYFATRFLPDGEAPEDIVQEAFEKLWQRRIHFSSREAMKAFLYITVKNRCLNLCKHHRVVRKYGDLIREEEEVTESYVVESEVLDNIYRALQKLPAGCRNVLELSYFQGLKNKDIADRLDVSVNTVKTQKKRGLHLLRAVLKISSLWSFLSLTSLF